MGIKAIKDIRADIDRYAEDARKGAKLFCDERHDHHPLGGCLSTKDRRDLRILEMHQYIGMMERAILSAKYKLETYARR